MAKDDNAPSYHRQFMMLKGCKDYDVLNTAHPRPSRAAQAKEPGAHRILGTDIYAQSEQRPLLNLETKEIPPHAARLKNAVTCLMRFSVIVSMHAIALYYGPRTFSWENLGLACIIYTIPGIFGITLCYHRMLTHRSFKTHKWFEYLCAFIATQAGQGDPIEVSTHRYHHLHCDTPLDPHSPYEGFWWSHFTWLFSTEASMLDYANVPDLKNQFFYRMLEVTFFPWLFVLKPLLTYYYLGGWGAVAWTQAIPMVAGWHSTWLVNSAAHTYGRQPYDTGDLSTNCWWVAAVSFGEGWHNSHHAFPYSARHGLEWWELDPTWYLICVLKALGIVWDVQVPSEKVRAAKRNKKLVQLTAKAH
eukprot:gene4324-4577_t